MFAIVGVEVRYVVIAVVALIVAVAGNLIADHLTRPAGTTPHPWSRRRIVTMAGLVIVAVAGGVIQAQLSDPSGDAPDGWKAAAPTQSPSAPSLPLASDQVTEDSHEGAGANGSAAATSPIRSNPAYLSDLEPLGAQPATDVIPFLKGLDQAAHSLSTETGGCARNQDSTFTYRISGDYDTFETTMAIQPSGESGSPVKAVKVLLTILLDGQEAESHVLNMGDRLPVRLDVQDQSTIGLRQQYRGDYPNTCYTPGTVFWADAKLT